MRKPLMVPAIAACLVLAVVGFLLPIMQGWIFLVLALYLLTSEFEAGRKWVVAARRRRWAPKHLHTFDDLTDPSK
jgi:uncharacterized membrane protein YbaN (DUF454 family)